MLSEAILKRRIGKVTSSVSGACLGVDPHCTQADAVEIIRGERPHVEVSSAMDRGNRCEGVVLDYGCEAARALTGNLKLTREDAPFVEHPEGWAADNTDALYVDAYGDVLAVGEGKTVALGGRCDWGEPGTDEVPPKVLVQGCWHLIAWPTARMCVVPVLFGGYDFSFAHYVINRDDDLLRRIESHLRDWHRRHIIEGEPAPLTADDTERIVRMWPQHTEVELAVDEQIDALVREHLLADTLAAEASKRRDEARKGIRLLMREAGRCVSDDWSITYRTPKSTLCIDWESVARELDAPQALIDKHSQFKTNSRRLLVSSNNKGKSDE